MKTIILTMTAFLAAAVFLTCERGGLYDNSGKSLLSLPGDTGGAPAAAAPTAIYIYSAGQHTGDLGGRAGADAICQAVAPPAFPIMAVRALITVSPTDTMPDLVPAASHGLPVYDITKTSVISSTWTELWNSNIDMTLGAAGVIAPGLEWWSGADPAGSYLGVDCVGWTSPLTMDTGWVGNSNFSNSQWIQWTTMGCSVNNYLLCVAY